MELHGYEKSSIGFTAVPLVTRAKKEAENR
jgi:hypothetical protein